MNLNRFLMAYKWKILLDAQNTSASLIRLTKIYYASTFAGVFLPATIGSDAVRTYMAKQIGIPLSVCLPSILIERMLGFLTLIIFVIVGCILYINNYTGGQVDARLILILASGIAIALTIATIFPFFIKKNSWTNKARKLKFYPKLEKLLQGYKEYSNHKSALAKFTFFTIIDNLSVMLWVYLVALGLGIEIPLIHILTFIPLITFAARLPISLGGIGVHEGGFTYFLTLLGHPVSIGLSLGIINHALMLASILPGAILYATSESPSENALET